MKGYIYKIKSSTSKECYIEFSTKKINDFIRSYTELLDMENIDYFIYEIRNSAFSIMFNSNYEIELLTEINDSSEVINLTYIPYYISLENNCINGIDIVFKINNIGYTPVKRIPNKFNKPKRARLLNIEKIWKDNITTELIDILQPFINDITLRFYDLVDDENVRKNNIYEQSKQLSLNYYGRSCVMKPFYSEQYTKLDLEYYIGKGTCHWTNLIMFYFLNALYPEYKFKFYQSGLHSICVSEDRLYVVDALEKYQKRGTVENILKYVFNEHAIGIQ